MHEMDARVSDVATRGDLAQLRTVMKMNSEDSDPAMLASLYQKFVWADALRREYIRTATRDADFMRTGLDQAIIGSYEEAFEADMYLCLWFSTLYVVVEGWPRLRQKHESVTPLLRSKQRDLLKDFRDATFHPTHFQDERLDALLRRGKDSFDWVNSLTDAFQEFFEHVAVLDRSRRRRT